MDVSRIAAALSDAPADADLPVENWHPEHCGRMDLVIRADGRWFHEGSPIGRPALVRLLSRVLRRDPDGYVLVTPAEKLSIEVEDVPFTVTDLIEEGGILTAVTNVGDRARLGPDHGLEMRAFDGDQVPYVHVRGDLWARFTRPVWYRLVQGMAMTAGDRATVTSDGVTFDLGPTS